jgi:hypothetical protein
MDGSREELARLGLDGVQGRCAFDGCDRPRRSRREPLCEGHYYQRRRGQDLRELKPQRRKGEGGVCILDGCDKPTKGGMCAMHHARKARHGDPYRVIGKDEQKRHYGAEHYAWVEDPGYQTMHSRVRKRFGSASRYTCSMGCGAVARQWALVTPRGVARLVDEVGSLLPVGLSVDDYSPLCVRCHKNFDMAWIGTQREALSALQAPEVPQEG